MKKKRIKISLSFILCLLLMVSCNSEVAVPKPPVYPRIYYPAKEYKVLDTAGLPYSFEYPVYAALNRTKDAKRQSTQDAKYWRNLDFNPFDATLHLSYTALSGLLELDSLKEEARRLAYEHSFKADDIQLVGMNNQEKKVFGTVYLIEGNTATNLNFYLTDSARHFFRGSLYFNEKTKPDSILPVFQFIKEDVEQLINTFKWKN